MKYFVVPDLIDNSKFEIIGAQGFIPQDVICLAPLMPDGSTCTDATIIDLIISETEAFGLTSVETTAVVNLDKISAKNASEASAKLAEAPRSAIRRAVAFGNQLVEDFSVENVVLGITVDMMTGPVLTKMSPVSDALRSGSLHEAISRLKSIPAQDKDVKYITDVRLLDAVNKIETFLGVPLSQTLV